MKRINPAAITGFMLCLCAIFFGIVTNGGVGSVLSLLHLPSAVVTFGGAFFAVLMTSDSFADFIDCLGSFKDAFHNHRITPDELMSKILEMSGLARKEGLLVLEEHSDTISFEYLKKGIMLVADGSDPELIKDILESEMIHTYDRNKRHVKFWENLGSYGPAWGMIGTLLGLIDMMRNMGGDTSAVGSAMSLALLTTLYGSILAN